jgi:hypothetical protein
MAERDNKSNKNKLDNTLEAFLIKALLIKALLIKALLIKAFLIKTLLLETNELAILINTNKLVEINK